MSLYVYSIFVTTCRLYYHCYYNFYIQNKNNAYFIVSFIL